MQKKQVYSDVIDEIKAIQRYATKGQPKKGGTPERIEYQITGNIFIPLERRANTIKQLGFFIIATNDLDENMTMDKMLTTYKEQQIRKKLKEKDLYFPDQKKKPSQNPTARWVFQCFQGVTVVYLEEQPPMVVNWQEQQQVIIDCLGENYRKIYS